MEWLKGSKYTVGRMQLVAGAAPKNKTAMNLGESMQKTPPCLGISFSPS